MTKQQYIRLEQIYNTFCLVHTRGEDSIIMGKALEALKIQLDQFAAAGLEDPQTESPQLEIKE